MKRLVLMTLLVLPSVSYGQSYISFDPSGVGAVEYIITKDKIVELDYDTPGYREFGRDQYFLDSDGYGKTLLKDLKAIVVDGKLFDQLFWDFQHDAKDQFDSKPAELFEENIKSIQSSVVLSETIGGRNVSYDAINMFRHYDRGCSCHPYSWKTGSIPFATPGNKKLEEVFILISFKTPIKALSILNGFVDPSNLKLFKANSRAQEIRVIDLDSGRVYPMMFEDRVYFNDLKFSQLTSHIRIEVSSVYGGNKYNDLCISAIIPHTWIRDQKSDSSYEEDIKKFQARR